ncbi:L-histidine N(alpha)-methyltransferase [Nocardia sp. NPDC003979]
MSTSSFTLMAIESQGSLLHDPEELARYLFQPQPRIPEYYGYDTQGSWLFEAVTKLPRYYPTRVEQALLEEIASEIAPEISQCTLVELGSGSGKKTGTLLRACATYAPPHFMPLDVDAAMIQHSYETLSSLVPGLRVTGVVGRYEKTFPIISHQDVGRRCVTALGSNIGNMLPDERLSLLELLCSNLNRGELLFVTADLTKSKQLLEAAYNDPPTDRTHTDFRLNRLIHINRIFGASFRPDRFYEYAHYDTDMDAIVVHLYSPEEQVIDLGRVGRTLTLKKGDSIVVDYSCKFEIDALSAEICELGCQRVNYWTDARYRWGAFLFEKQ